MQILIYGCTRLTDSLAPILVQDGHQVTVMDTDADRLAILQKQTDVSTMWIAEPLMLDYLRQGDLAGSQAFFSLTSDDHENILLSQMASHIYNIPRVMCLLSDPQLQDFYQPLGISVLNGGPDSVSAARDFLEE